MSVLLGALLAAVAALTALHLRSRPRGGAAPFPSFQHLEGLAPRRRPAWPLEEPLRWALRVLAALLVALALLLARRESGRPLVVLVEPGAADRWDEASALATRSSGVAVALTFDGETPVVAGSPKALEAGERARRTLSACSATTMACLVRAASDLGGDAIVASAFVERRRAFDRLRSFRFLRLPTPASGAEPQPTPRPGPPGTSRVDRVGEGTAARIWAAALEVASTDLGGGTGDVTVLDRGAPPGASRGLRLLPVTSAGEEARSTAVGSVVLPEDAALAAGRATLDLSSSLSLAPGDGLRLVVPSVLARRGDLVLVAATEEDLGRWAHAGTLVALARVILFEAGRRVALTEAPVGGSHRWTPDAPVGLLDVAPGRYERDDGRVELHVSRQAGPDGPPLTDAELTAIGGTPIPALPSPAAASPWPVALLVVALLARLVDAPRHGRPAVLVAFAVGVSLVLLLIADGSFIRKVPVPPDPLDAVVAAADRPRVDLLSTELPAELRTGEAGLLRATLDARHAGGRDVTLSARTTSGPRAEKTARVSSDRETVTLTLPLLSTTEGISFALVSAAVGDERDAVVIPVTSRTHETRRLVLASAPSWEARAAGESLAKRGALERLTRVGATAVLARGTRATGRPLDPVDRLAGDLSAIDLIVLVGFTGDDLSAKEPALARYVERGGALLFLGEPPRLRTLPLPTAATEARESALPSTVTGAIGEKRVTFLGFPPWRSSPPLAGLVLGRLEGAPWIVGRAHGRGRVAALTAPDAWRAGPGYDAVLDEVVAWLEAGRGEAGAVLSPDLATLALGDQRVSLPTQTLAGLPVDVLDPIDLLPQGRARRRIEARRHRTPFLEADSASEVASLQARLSEPPPLPPHSAGALRPPHPPEAGAAGRPSLPRREAARASDVVWLALVSLLVAEVALRRRAA